MTTIIINIVTSIIRIVVSIIHVILIIIIVIISIISMLTNDWRLFAYAHAMGRARPMARTYANASRHK